MATQEVKRKLAAIPDADRRLMSKDEVGTIRTPNAYKERLERRNKL